VRFLLARKGRALRPAFLFLSAVTLLPGCAIFDTGGNRDNLLNQAAKQEWRAEVIRTGHFDLFTLERLNIPGGPLTVYIEGDGRAFLTRQRVSPDPTPRRPVGLRLALDDPAPNVLYLARPCQYANLASKPPCNPRYWTSARLSPEVITALSAAIDKTKNMLKSQSIELVGYSGGGGAAALLAARRTDVGRLITIAANLDTDLWTRMLGVSPMNLSVNPTSAAHSIRHIPQMHLAGSDDAVVSPAIGRSFLKSANLPANRHFRIIDGFSHTCCWQRGWRDRISRIRAALAITPGS
jgi:pimeloyl-ACP methyl ester carboxylesterase